MSDQAICEICGEPMPEGEEMFKYHGYSGPCPKPPHRQAPTWPPALQIVREGVSGIVPQGPVFHWRDGWMFARGEADEVHIWQANDPLKPAYELRIPLAEWHSIIKALSRPIDPAKLVPGTSEIASR